MCNALRAGLRQSKSAPDGFVARTIATAMVLLGATFQDGGATCGLALQRLLIDLRTKVDADTEIRACVEVEFRALPLTAADAQ